MAKKYDPTDFLTEEEAAEVVGLATNTLRNGRSRETIDIPYYKLGGKRRSVVRYRYSDLLAWLESKRVDIGANHGCR